MTIQDELHNLFDYKDGELFYKNSNELATRLYTSHNYKFIIKDTHNLKYAHNVIYTMFNGFKRGYIDHINNNPLDNRIENLRLCSQSNNLCNTRKRSDNTSGYKGIHFDPKNNSYKATVQIDYKQRSKRFNVLKYSSKEEALQNAINWVQCKRIELHGSFANHG